MADKLTVVPFMANHIRMFELQEKQAEEAGPCQSEDSPIPESIERTALDAVTIKYGDRIVGCMGINTLDENSNTGTAWALFSQDIRSCLRGVAKHAINYLESSKLKRIETVIDPEFEESKRWVEMLGFKQEGLMNGYSSDNKDVYLYVRV